MDPKDLGSKAKKQACPPPPPLSSVEPQVTTECKFEGNTGLTPHSFSPGSHLNVEWSRALPSPFPQEKHHSDHFWSCSQARVCCGVRMGQTCETLEAVSHL